jgi:hypothetical protein
LNTSLVHCAAIAGDIVTAAKAIASPMVKPFLMIFSLFCGFWMLVHSVV